MRSALGIEERTPFSRPSAIDLNVSAVEAATSFSASQISIPNGSLSGSYLVPLSPNKNIPGTNIRTLIAQKEKELSDINEYRVKTLEEALLAKEKELSDQRRKFTKLKEDFQYNLKLLEDRDSELERYDTAFDNLKSVVRDRDIEVTELKVQVAELQSQVNQEASKLTEEQRHHEEKIAEIREQLESTRWARDEELRKQRDEFEPIKRDLQRKLRDKEDEVDAQRKDMAAAFDELTRKREMEIGKREEELQSKNAVLLDKLKQLQRDVEVYQVREQSTQAESDKLRDHVRDLEKKLKRTEWELEDVRHLGEVHTAEVEEYAHEADRQKQEAIREYEMKNADLTQSLQRLERTHVQQKEDFDLRLLRVVSEKDEQYKALASSLESKVESLLLRVKATEAELEDSRNTVRQLSRELQEKDIQVDKVRKESVDALSKKEDAIKELKDEVWNRDAELRSFRDRADMLKKTVEERREEISSFKQELAAALDRERELKRQLTQKQLEWEKEVEERTLRTSNRSDDLLKRMQSEREQTTALLKSREDSIQALEREVARLKADLSSAKGSSAPQTSVAPSLRIVPPSMSITGEGTPHLSPSLFSFPNSPPPTPSLPSRPPSAAPISSAGGGERAYNGNVTFLEAENSRLRAKVQELQDQNHKIRDVIAEMRQEMEMMQRTTDDTTGRGTGRNTPRSGAQEERLMAEKTELLEEIRMLNSYNAFLQKRTEGSLSSGADGEETRLLRQRVNELSETNSRLRRELDDARQEVSMKTRELQGTRATLDNSESLLEQQSAKVAALEQQLRRDQIGTSGKSIDALEKENQDLRVQLDEATATVRRLSSEREKLMDISNMLRSDLSRTMSESYQETSMKVLAEKAERDMAQRYQAKMADIETSMEEIIAQNRSLKHRLRRLTSEQEADDWDTYDRESARQSVSLRSSFASAAALRESRSGPLSRSRTPNGDNRDLIPTRDSSQRHVHADDFDEHSVLPTDRTFRSTSSARQRLEEMKANLQLSGHSTRPVEREPLESMTSRTTASQRKVLSKVTKKKADMAATGTTSRRSTSTGRVRNYNIAD